MKSNIINPIKAQYSLTGGIHLEENKGNSSSKPLQICPLPKQLMIPLNMHAGTDAIAIIDIGEQITVGQNIAKADKPISAFIHSPVDGKVIAIKPMNVANRSGLEEFVILIECNQQQPEGHKNRFNWSSKSADQLLDIVRLAGVVGLGGAGFPSHQKINNSRQQSHTLLLNGAECEPYISCDDRTMQDFSGEVIEGALILARILDCEKIQIAIEDNKPDAISAMIAAVAQLKLTDTSLIDVQVIEIPTIYPSGGERQLIEVITGEQVPSGSLPMALGYTVQNVGTALAVHDAVILNKPLVERIVTVTGNAVSRPGNYRVTIGTPIRYLLEFAGWNEDITERLIHGGPMMGFPLASADRPISKISNCIIAATAEELPEPLAERPCIRCGQCAVVCPVSLLPQQLLWFSKSGETAKAEAYKLMDCIECGACAYVCPSQIPLVDYYRFSKAKIKSRAAQTNKAEHSKQRFEFRNRRLENAQNEKRRLREERIRLANKNKQGDAKKQAVADALARIQAKAQAKKQAKTNANPAVKDNSDV